MHFLRRRRRREDDGDNDADDDDDDSLHLSAVNAILLVNNTYSVCETVAGDTICINYCSICDPSLEGTVDRINKTGLPCSDLSSYQDPDVLYIWMTHRELF